MDKIKYVFLSLIFSFGLFSGVLAHGGDSKNPEHLVSTDEILKEIRLSQKVDIDKDIDCKKVTDEQFERLGDSVMSIVHQGEEHEFMDRMMGGEGSDSLRNMHIGMGQRYLGCPSEDISSTMMNNTMMGAMMNSNYFDKFDHNAFTSMMRNAQGGGQSGFFMMAIFWVAVLFALVFFVKWIIDINKKK